MGGVELERVGWASIDLHLRSFMVRVGVDRNRRGRQAIGWGPGARIRLSPHLNYLSTHDSRESEESKF